ncbi:protease inhibitor I42 family protein [Microbacterium sp. CFBP9034]|uniref:protease inhibitor I42 family protein n=1 Tax=Microbacterium sp. CFBP9034 TaxID=3096540 RepID=UPI002A69A794|nr:protease inhibitor I42 family protein [Microbacterium sp. CFBP9034]MDY0910942.1 protease inhibitor I42 family protein [Microbacterium sp. CFBP9034]
MEHVTTAVGQLLRIALESFGGAGYEWRLRDPVPGLQLETRESLPPEAGSPPGSPHQVVFTFVAEEPGIYDVMFVLQRPWEAEALKETAYVVEVEED